MSISLIGSSSAPADNGSQGGVGGSWSITPPAGGNANDKVILIAHHRSITSFDATITNAGGQTWTNRIQYNNTTDESISVWECDFNGTWSANPTIQFQSSPNDAVASIYMFIFRSTLGKMIYDGQSSRDDFAGVSSSCTLTGRTTTAESTVHIGIWISADDNTWNDSAETDWNRLGSQQYRNTSGSDHSACFDYKTMTSSGSTGTVTRVQATLGPDAGRGWIISFRERTLGFYQIINS